MEQMRRATRPKTGRGERRSKDQAKRAVAGPGRSTKRTRSRVQEYDDWAQTERSVVCNARVKEPVNAIATAAMGKKRARKRARQVKCGDGDASPTRKRKL
jgi:hypothetical protein